MTKDTILKEIREKVIAANPEIVELKFGCEIQAPFEDVRVLVSLYTRPNGSHHLRTQAKDYSAFYDHKGLTTEDIEKYTIIGRPIRLADILLVLPFPTYLKTMGEYVRLNTEDSETAELWDLKQDDLNAQSDYTLQFIHKLLV